MGWTSSNESRPTMSRSAFSSGRCILTRSTPSERFRAGALGYINKRYATSRIVEAIRHVRDGKIFLCEETAEQLLASAVGRGKHLTASGVESLSDRELEVFRLIGQGLTTSQIARHLHRSVNTVESHREKIKDKLALKTAGELNLAAVQWMLENG